MHGCSYCPVLPGSDCMDNLAIEAPSEEECLNQAGRVRGCVQSVSLHEKGFYALWLVQRPKSTSEIARH